MSKSEFSNGQITIIWEHEKCIHSRVCSMYLPKDYNPTMNPWIKIENATTDEIKKQVSRCPSGALSIRNDVRKEY